LRSSCHLLPLDLPSQVVLHPPGGGPPVGVEDTPETPCIRANRLRLREVLLTGLAVHWGKNATRIEEDAEAGHATVWFEDGSSALGDLVVGADGTWSKGMTGPLALTLDMRAVIALLTATQFASTCLDGRTRRPSRLFLRI